MKTIKLLLLFICASLMSVMAQNVFFVKENVTGPAVVAISWANASSDLQGVINGADSGDEIWVAAGTYAPMVIAGNGISDSDKSFVLKAGVKVYGGFAGTEISLDQRDWDSNTTILNGGGNVRHVVIIAGTNNEDIFHLDGFSITEGKSVTTGANITVNGITVTHSYGGGIFAVSNGSITLTNNTITGNINMIPSTTSNYGGGLYVKVTGSGTAIFSNNIISENEANRGGGVFIDIASAATFTFSNNTVNDNKANAWGGGVYTSGSGTAKISNNIISGNTSTANGAGITSLSSEGSSVSISNNAVVGNINTGGNGGGIIVRAGSGSTALGTFTITNNTIVGNTSSSAGGGIYGAMHSMYN